MSADAATYPARTLGRARLGVSLLFLANGAMFANLAPRLPEIRERLDVTYGQFGWAVGAASLGGIVLGLFAGPAVRRFGSARVAAVALVMQALAVWGAGVAPHIVLFAAFLFLNGALDAHTDVAQNAHGIVVQKHLGRSIINALHAMWSLGAALGGLVAGAALVLGLSVGAQLAIMTAVFVTVATIAYSLSLGPEHGKEAAPPRHEHSPSRLTLTIPWRAVGLIAALGLLSIAGAETEDAGFTWSSSYLKSELDSPQAMVGFGFVALMLLHFVGRLISDRLVDRFGARAVVSVGGLVTAAGMGAALAWPTLWGTILGFGLAGLGAAPSVPLAYGAADDIPGLRGGTGITVVSWLLRVAFFAGPPVVGALADATSLRVGLVIVPACGLVVAVTARALAGRTASAASIGPTEAAPTPR